MESLQKRLSKEEAYGLKELYLDDCKITDEFLLEVANSEHHVFVSNLETLHLRRNDISATGLTHLCSALGFESIDGNTAAGCALKRLDIRQNNLKDSCHKVLYSLLNKCENIENVQYTC